ncbi:ComGF family competence protein [Halalkalibacillus sediminis]|nr:ComGF family competence protein [Halalkalibacillus sediminis]
MRRIIDSESGITLISLLLALSVLIMIFPLLNQMLSSIEKLNTSASIDTLAIEQFYYFLENELNHSEKITLATEKITFHRKDGSIVTYSKYEDKLRRQSNDLGHELLIFNVLSMKTFQLNDHAFQLTLQFRDGEFHEKYLLFPYLIESL